jgi:hypothetical protein
VAAALLLAARPVSVDALAGFGGGPARRRGGSAPPAPPTPLGATPGAVLDTVKAAAARHGAQIAATLASSGLAIAVVDGFVEQSLVLEMRMEAEHLRALGRLTPSKSTRWDGASSSVVAYEKHAVEAFEIVGGAGYAHDHIWR